MLLQTFLPVEEESICVVFRWHGNHAPALIICPGLGTTMSEPRYLLSILARRHYELGFNVFQFDYVGEGDSTGDYHCVTWKTIVESSRVVLDFVHSLGCNQVGLLGYGIGNLASLAMLNLSTVTTAVLISPQLELFARNDSHRAWNYVEQLKPNVPVYPQVTDTKKPIRQLWQAIVGEAIAPSQPCGPLNSRLLQELRGFDPFVYLRGVDKPVLILSEEKEDQALSDSQPDHFYLLDHTPTLYKPSWHWDADCRAQILERTTTWTQINLPLGTDHKGTPLLLGPISSSDANDRTPVTVTIDQQSILGILHLPPNTVTSKRVCVIYEPGVPGQRVDIHRCGTRISEMLTEQGFTVFRYDSRGTGVSDGEFYEFTWSRKLDDVEKVIAALHSHLLAEIDRFVIIGHSAGGRTACLIANRNELVCGCILWGPILVEPAERVGEQLLTRHPSGTLVTEYCGLWLGVKYNLDERKYDFLYEFEVCRKPMLILFGEEEENQLNQRSVEEIAQKQPEKEHLTLPGPHGFSSESIEAVFRKTVDWLLYNFT